MTLIDRYILVRFLGNFMLLFCMLFVFAVSIDIILNLDGFVDIAQEHVGEEGGFLPMGVKLIELMLDFQAPRFFQLYAYLHGMVAIGAMGFTLAQMHRFKELVAVLASGVSLQRVAMPFIVGMFAISILQLMNQEFLLPRVAPLLLRDHSEIGQHGLNQFEIELTSDGHGNLLQSPRFDPQANTLAAPTFIERSDRQTTIRRVTAESAHWDDAQRGWRLESGLAITTGAGDLPTDDAVVRHEPLEFYPSAISPKMLTVRRFAHFAGMLSLRQISDMLQSDQTQDSSTLIRYRFSRFSSVLVNVLVLLITLPSFLLREPSNLLRQSVLCTVIVIPCMFGAMLGMMAPLPGIPAAAGVFLPAFVLIPIALARVTFIKT